ncbi:mitochondrial ATPase expression-domain-containing protein [Phyllosticta citricarpa]|uniref:Mitochondrial ATPase expression-domain-containing protein n=2 Tax=Phyllosticta TaxID=121621 RepID=A0ABR1LW41_9PEZI
MPPSGSATALRRPPNIRVPKYIDGELYHIFRHHRGEADVGRGLLKALRARDNGRILQYLHQGADKPGFIRAIPATTFTEILRLFGHDRELQPVADSLEHSWWLPDHLQHMRLRGFQKKYTAMLRGFVNMRIDAGAALSPLDLKLVLRAAGEATDVNLATDAINELKNTGCEPDDNGYNSLMRAILFHRSNDGSTQIGFTINALWFRTRKRGLVKWAPQPDEYMDRVTNVYRDMLESGGVANEKTIILLMISYAREGKVYEMNKMMWIIWGVSVNEVLRGEQTSAPKPMPPGSPLRPTEDLLLGIVEAYGTNSQSMTALALIDFMSAAYDIAVSNRVWLALLIRVYVESNLIQGNPLHKRLHWNPRLPKESPLRFFRTLCSEPYNVKPTMPMLWFVNKPATQAFRWVRAVELIRTAAQLYDESAKEATHAAREVRVAKRRVAEGGVSSAPIFELAQRRETKLLEFRRNRVMIELMCHMLIKGGVVPGSFHAFGEDDEGVAEEDELSFVSEHPKGNVVVHPYWPYIGLPSFIKEFIHVLPPAVSYRTLTGYVRLDLHEHKGFVERPSEPGLTHNHKELNAHMTRRVADRMGFKRELAEYERHLTGDSFHYSRLMERKTHFEDPPDLSILEGVA